ncbi:Y-family DNA polymerase [Haloferula chungangensis]|uniref:Y-family DNA polymerase n=1 Tax=Haloferula chungangensis TaxID=1048331 RepID=A0ABW2L8S5_9BACT
MYLTLHLPSLPLEALLRHQPEKRRFPCAVAATEKSQHSVPILALNRRAAAFHLEPGFSITRALARCPRLLVLPRDPEAEAHALRDLLQLAESLTPDFELTTPDTLTLDLSLHPQFQISNFKSPIEALGLPAHLASGPTPDLAHLFSLSPSTSDSLVFRGPHSRWSHGSHSSFPSQNVPQEVFHNLPLHLARHLPHLELENGTLEISNMWGLHSLGDLARLPRQDLAERLGPAIAQLHDILHVKHHRPLRLIHPIESFVSSIHLEHPIESSQALLFLIRKYLQNILNRLNSRYLKANQIHVSLKLSNESLKQIAIDLPEPSAALETLLAPLQSRLESLQLSAPIESLELSLTPSESSSGQHQLFGHSIRQPHRLADTLIRLSALLGDAQIGFPVPHFTHRPDSFHLASAHRLFGSAGLQPASQAQLPPSRRKATQTNTDHCPLITDHPRASGPPLSRFRPPLEIAVAFDPPARGHPQPLALLTGPHRGRILKSHGPFPISGHWWSPSESWQQLEWDIELETHHLLRLSHTPPDLWHLQGHYF